MQLKRATTLDTGDIFMANVKIGLTHLLASGDGNGNGGSSMAVKRNSCLVQTNFFNKLITFLHFERD